MRRERKKSYRLLSFRLWRENCYCVNIPEFFPRYFGKLTRKSLLVVIESQPDLWWKSCLQIETNKKKTHHVRVEHNTEIVRFGSCPIIVILLSIKSFFSFFFFLYKTDCRPVVVIEIIEFCFLRCGKRVTLKLLLGDRVSVSRRLTTNRAIRSCNRNAIETQLLEIFARAKVKKKSYF